MTLPGEARGTMLQVDALRSGYGRIPILAGVGFAVAPGEFVGILGHNGMGKSTLLRTLMGYLPATAGRVTFEGRDITRLSPTARARLGIGPARCRDRSPDAARVVAVAPVRTGRLTTSSAPRSLPWT